MILSTQMQYLSVLLSISGIIWIVVGIKTHVDWIERVFRQECQKISWQQIMIDKYGYSRLNDTNRRLSPKRGIVFGYWMNEMDSIESSTDILRQNSPIIFDYANIALVTSTSVALLIVVSIGLFSAIGLT